MMNKFLPARRVFCGLILLAFFGVWLAADEKTDKVDKLFAQWDTIVTPGCALAIIKDGEIIYKRGYGMAKIEDGIVMTPSKIFDIGSVSKQFTATCIVMLIKEGKVSIDDDIRKYFPEMPKYEKPITVNHLIHHTSGLRDYNGLLELAGFRPESDCPNVDEALEVIFKQKKLNYAPGEEYSYTNTGYFLLGQIVERVSGKSLNEFAQERIFKPLGMKHTIYQDDHTQIIKDRATGYDQTDKGYKIDLSNWDETGDGNVYTSVEDLYLWDQAFYNNKLGQDIMDMLHTVGALNNGKKIDYAFGLTVTEYKGLKVVEHGGSWAGFRAAIMRFPDQKFSAICLANLSDINPSGLCFKVADIYLADLLKEKPKEEKKKPEPVSLSKQELEEKAGNYQDDKFGTWISLAFKDEKLSMRLGGRREYVLAPVSKTTFVALDAPAEIIIEFLPATKGKLNKAVVKVEGEERYNLVKAAPLSPLTPAKLKEYAGDYVSEELLNAKYRFVVEKDNLILKFRSASKEQLKAMAPDKFSLGGLNIEFFRKGDRVAGFNLSIGRAAGIEFVKK
jgi:CubicO group peptidase (beta-lactamase class C family)